tara:strand:+ start:7755 stop:8201 length:447 start_codon:yes stop_codon:yes gene_type:complete
VRVVPFEPGHGEAILNGQLNDEKSRPPTGFGKFIPDLVIDGMAFTGLENGHVIASAGVYPMWDGVGEGWFIAAAALDAHHIGVARQLKTGLRQIAEEQALHRVQAAVRSDWEKAIRLVRFLDMEHEGRMRQYSADGADYERYAWLLQP